MGKVGLLLLQSNMECKNKVADDFTKWQAPDRTERDGIKYPTFPSVNQVLDEIESGDVPDFDALVATFPRSGTARLLEIVWLLLHDCDIKKARETDNSQRYLFFEARRLSERDGCIHHPHVVAKTHVNFQLAQRIVEKQKKVIVGLRNPKDVLVSMYHFYRMNIGCGLFPGTWHQFFEYYRQGGTSYGDYFRNTLSWWEQQHRENILIVRYEVLNENLFKAVTEIAAFLGKSYTKEQLTSVAEWTTFSNMKENPSTNYTSDCYTRLKNDISPYMRKGSVGDWKNYFSEEENEYIDDLCHKLCEPAGLSFKFA